MDDVDRLLNEAGARWRASQPPPPSIDDVSFVPARSRTHVAWSVIGAGAVVIAATLVVAVWTQVVRPPATGIGTGAPAASAAATPANIGEACAVTRPNPPFAAPSPYPASPPDDRSAWFGTPALWTMLELDGEVWNGLPQGPGGLTQKLFWWSSNWPGMREEQQPAITVVATRLDGPGTVTTDDATNAAADSLGGEAMLVGIEFPTAGCWQLTAQYRGAVLSYIVLIRDE